MAIYHLSVKTISRSAGRSATAAAAYRAGVEITDARTGEVHDYSRRDGVLSSDLFVPDSAPAWASDRQALWNQVEQSENRKNSTVAREFEVALPVELSEGDRRRLVGVFCRELVEQHGIAVDASIHAPDKNGDLRNYHAHILTSTRRLDDNGFGQKARELDAKATGPELVAHWRERWAVLTNIALEQAGVGEKVDHRSHEDQGIELEPTIHQGVHATNMNRRGLHAERVQESETIRRENATRIVERPELVLEKLTMTQAVFSRRDIARELNRYIDDASQFQSILARLDVSPELVRVNATEIAEARYSTREMVRVETGMAESGKRLAGALSHNVSGRHVDAALSRHASLSGEQKNAIRHITEGGALACVVGDAGTGKSFAMAAAREAWEAAGYRVIGAALAGKAAEGLHEGSGIQSRTLASLEHTWKRAKANGRKVPDAVRLDSRSVLVIDEAGMVGARQLSRVLAVAEATGAKVVLLGDDKQLAAIEAGAPFRALIERNGAAEITEIRRQREDWARLASQEFARSRDGVRGGLDAYQVRGAVHLAETRDAAMAAVANAWMKGRDGGGSAIILAHTNADVIALNQGVREARIGAGELGEESRFSTDRGSRQFAADDRVVFLKNDSALGVKNGSLGTVTAGRDGSLTVRMDGPEGRTIEVDANVYAALDHGYAVTIHKSQGVTVDRAYVLASGGMDRSLTYVAMTRHREAAELFAGKDDFKDYEALARRLGRAQPKESALDYLDYAQRRGDDRRSTFEDARAWIERAHGRLGEVAERARNALHRSMERFGLAGDPPSMEVAVKHQVSGQPAMAVSVPPKRRTTAELATEHAKKRTARGIVALSEKSSHTLDEVRAAALTRLKSEYQAVGKNPRHHAAEILRKADQEMVKWAHTVTGKSGQEERPTLPDSKNQDGAIKRGRKDEEAFGQLIDQRTFERAGRAARLTARLEQFDDRMSEMYRTHDLARPAEPRGLSAMLGGKGKHDQDVAVWQQQKQRIARRTGDVRNRLRVVINVARGDLDARRLGTAKVKREQPELWKRVESFRESQRIERQKKRRESAQEISPQTLDQDRPRGR